MLNRKIKPDFTYQNLKDILIDIYTKQSNAYKINIAFASILYNTIEDIFKYHYSSSNILLFEHAFFVTDREDIDKFMKKIIGLDLTTNYYFKKPSSNWVLAEISNVVIFIYKMKHKPIGKPPLNLPDYIKNSKSIYALAHHKTNIYDYNDDNCFFRCLALHPGANIRGLERITKRLKTELEAHTGKSFEKGVAISHLPVIEVFFQISVNVYSLNEDGSADLSLSYAAQTNAYQSV